MTFNCRLTYRHPHFLSAKVIIDLDCVTVIKHVRFQKRAIYPNLFIGCIPTIVVRKIRSISASQISQSPRAISTGFYPNSHNLVRFGSDPLMCNCIKNIFTGGNTDIFAIEECQVGWPVWRTKPASKAHLVKPHVDLHCLHQYLQEFFNLNASRTINDNALSSSWRAR